VTKISKIVFHISVLFLIIIYLFPGSLLGFLFYRDLSIQPDIIGNPFGTAINHFICYICVSFLGFFSYLKSEKLKILLYAMLILSIILEAFHFIIPRRSFQIEDLIANILGVLVAYFVIKIYLLIKP
tara:strand:- start:161 stop:541 length:381 start_codon:yes stop_codon:yes gene_type:complete